MGGIDIDLSEFDDPAPALGNEEIHAEDSEASSEGEEQPQKHNGVSRQPKKRKLPFRADVVVDGKRYKGRKVTRSDVDLDVETLGIDDEGKPDDEPDGDASDVSDEDDRLGDGDELEDDESGLEENESQGSDAEKEAVALRDSRASQLKAEERAVAARLAQVEEKERERALAVKRQKQVYDAVVDLRIRIEPLMALVRQLPSEEQKQESSDWEESEQLKEMQDNAEKLLKSLTEKVQDTWEQSFPSREEPTDIDFENWRAGVLDTWGRKVDEASGVVPKGGFKKLDTTVSAQLKASLATGKHLERMQRVKEAVPLIGTDMEMPQGSNKSYFDDGDFYRALLREVIESGEGSGGGLRYAQLSKSGKVKKKRDRSFAKGRRIKYDVHEKLIGFLAPVPQPDPGPVDEIIAAMFGKRGTVASVEQ